ncbi:MAG: hypothetical protein LBI10_05040 [Deltaproteobacteria bacterium]|nr:hypothetical protein [Deltaproteobacteria bacterium]
MLAKATALALFGLPRLCLFLALATALALFWLPRLWLFFGLIIKVFDA